MKRYHLDTRRLVLIPGNHEETLDYAIKHWVETAQKSIADHGFFAVALSGGSTPKQIFQGLSQNYAHALDWSKVWLFWSDERAVSPDHKDSNFRMAMIEGGLTSLPLASENIHRMEAEKEIEANSVNYQHLIERKLKGRPFDLIMLGMGDDGHTASLFPHTKGVHCHNKLVIANYVPQKDTWRMSFTFNCINHASHICLYVLGANKAETVHKVLFSPLNPDTYPSQNVGSEIHPALWILDQDASALIVQSLVSQD